MKEEMHLAPVTGWETRLIPAYGAVAVTLRYLVNPMESPEQAHQSPHFVMHAPQLRELAEGLLQAAQRLEKADSSVAQPPRH